jgi:hypothetical protein
MFTYDPFPNNAVKKFENVQIDKRLNKIIKKHDEKTKQ